MLTLQDYLQIFYEETANYKKKPGIQRTYKKLMTLTRSEEKTIQIMIKYLKYCPKEISNRKSNINYNIKKYWQKKLNRIQ